MSPAFPRRRLSHRKRGSAPSTIPILSTKQPTLGPTGCSRRASLDLSSRLDGRSLAPTHCSGSSRSSGFTDERHRPSCIFSPGLSVSTTPGRTDSGPGISPPDRPDAHRLTVDADRDPFHPRHFSAKSGRRLAGRISRFAPPKSLSSCSAERRRRPSTVDLPQTKLEQIRTAPDEDEDEFNSLDEYSDPLTPPPRPPMWVDASNRDSIDILPPVHTVTRLFDYPQGSGQGSGAYSFHMTPTSGSPGGAHARGRPPYTAQKSPPMAGASLKFNMCQSPRATKIYTDQPFYLEPGTEPYRDSSGRKGLWMGYCLKKESSNEDRRPVAAAREPHRPSAPDLTGRAAAAVARPDVPSATPACRTVEGPSSVAAVPVGAGRPAATGEESPAPPALWRPPTNGRLQQPPEPGIRRHVPPAKAGGDRSEPDEDALAKRERALTEFDDIFVTQVFNYLSLGYPVTARDFDTELARVSCMSADDLSCGDAEIMRERNYKFSLAPDQGRTNGGPRWHALRLYISEWARQHPDLSFQGPYPLRWSMNEEEEESPEGYEFP